MKKRLKNKNLRLILLLATLLGVLVAVRILTPKAPKDDSSRPPALTPTPTPSSVPVEEAGRGDPDFRLSLEPTIIYNYPLFHFLPFETRDWYVEYTGPRQLRVILRQDTPTLRQEVLDWVEDQGGDPQEHQFKWELKD